MLEGRAETITPITFLLLTTLVILSIMGLKLRWFRARMNLSSHKTSGDLISMSGIYRKQPFETYSMSSSQSISNLPSHVTQIHENGVRHKGLPQASGTSLSEVTVNYSSTPNLYSSSTNPLNLQSPVSSEENNVMMNDNRIPVISSNHVPQYKQSSNSSASNIQNPTTGNRNPIAKQANYYETSSNYTDISLKQSTAPKKKTPAPKGILQKARAPLPPSLAENKEATNFQFKLPDSPDDYVEESES